jgi:hypothetical protein
LKQRITASKRDVACNAGYCQSDFILHSVGNQYSAIRSGRSSQVLPANVGSVAGAVIGWHGLKRL